MRDDLDFVSGAVTDGPLEPRPIAQSQILAGTPVAQGKTLGISPDGLLSYALWDCTAGTFRWHFRSDEIVHILEGEVRVRRGDAEAPRRLGPGDVAYFPAGLHTVWEVDTYVRKLAVFRSQPGGLRAKVRGEVGAVLGRLRARVDQVRRTR
ncbi:MAG: cupin domain-containing protein [Kofleriaceae bacterium]